MKKEYLKTAKAAAAVLLIIAAGISYCFCSGDGKTVSLTASEAETVSAVSEVSAEDSYGTSAETAGGNDGSGVASGEGTADAAAVPAEAEPSAVCYIYVCGEVRNPGVYELEEGSRIYAAIEAAGGFTEQAAKTALNLAAPIADGMQITVYSEAELLRADEAAGGEADGNGTDSVGTNAESAAGSGIRTDAGSGVENALPGAGGENGDGADTGESAGGRVNINTATKEELMTLTGIGESKAEKILQYREENGRFETIEDIMKVSGIKEAGFQKIKDRITV